MASATHLVTPERASAKLRRVQESVRALIREDQDKPEMASSVCELLARIEEQLHRVAGLQELFEWYGRMPTEQQKRLL